MDNNSATCFLGDLDVKETYKLRPELLLHPNIVKPLHSVAPRRYIKKGEWDDIRRNSYAEHNYCCFACGLFADYDQELKRFKDVKLNAHEVYRIDYDSYTVELEEVVSLCTTCHNYIHSGRSQSLYDKGIFDEQAMHEIITQGDRLLVEAGLPTGFNVDDRDYTESWSKWKLVFRGKEYYSQFKDDEDRVNSYK